MDMYMKNGEVGSAGKVFDGMSERDMVAWTGLMTGYVKNGRAREAVGVFERMRREGVDTGDMAAASVAAACAQLRLLHPASHGLLQQGNEEYDAKRQALYDYYHPLEYLPTMPIKEKRKLMEEWYDS